MDSIVRRFKTGAMSYGSIAREVDEYLMGYSNLERARAKNCMKNCS